MKREHAYIFIGSLAFAFLACTASAPRSGTARMPATETAKQQTETRPNQEIFMGGSEEAEIAEFRKMGQEIREVMTRQTKELRNQPDTQRAFHSKGHACLRGELVLVDRPVYFQEGIFAPEYESRPWKLWARFSNGVGWTQKDTELDIRGLALKILEVPGNKFMSDETQTQDMIMITSPVGFGRDAREFMDFAHANSQKAGVVGTAKTGSYAATHPTVRTPIVRGIVSTLKGISTLAQMQYWSGTPYRMGPQMAVKYTVKPETCRYVLKPVQIKNSSPETKFRDDLYARGENGFCMGLYFQTQSPNVSETPIEDASIEWNTQFHKVAQLRFFPQKYSDTEKESLNSMCETMAFNPWHSIEAHRPLGNQNRARRWVYDSSRAHRNGGGALSTPIPGWEIK